MTEDENSRLYGKCNNPYGHGHDYVLHVTAQGPIDARTGQIVPLPELDYVVQQCVLSLFDCRNINLEVPQFASRVPTTENVTDVISGLLARNWTTYVSGPARLARVHIRETDRNGFEAVIGPDGKQGEKETQETAVPVNG